MFISSIPEALWQQLFALSPHPHVATLIKLDVDDIGPATHRAILDVLLLGSRRQVDGHDNFLTARITKIGCLVSHLPSSSTNFRKNAGPLFWQQSAHGRLALFVDEAASERKENDRSIARPSGTFADDLKPAYQYHISTPGSSS
jgi:hypothetical protein